MKLLNRQRNRNRVHRPPAIIPPQAEWVECSDALLRGFPNECVWMPAPLDTGIIVSFEVDGKCPLKQMALTRMVRGVLDRKIRGGFLAVNLHERLEEGFPPRRI